jgi:hypothetical protein
MTTVQPPAFAARLLKRLVPAQDHDALLGDLCEEYQRGRSIAWYWLQILVAIVVRSWKDVRDHTLVAARAIVTGLVAQMFLPSAFSSLQNVLTGAGFMWGDAWIGLPWYWHWPYSASLVLIMQGIWIAGNVMIGWLVVRLHREHGVTMVFVYCGAIGALHAAGLLQIVHAAGWSPDLLAPLWAAANGQIREWLLLITGGYLATRPAEVA